MKKLSILFGSGVSLKSNMPKMSKITSDILYNDNLRYDSSRYFFEHKEPQDCSKVKAVRELLFILKNKIDLFFKNYDKIYLKQAREANYEDLYFAVKQIIDSITFEFENPILFDLINSLKIRFSKNHNGYSFQNIVEDSMLLIESTVLNHLNKKINNTSQFNLIINLNKQLDLKNIFTLNHDLVMETFLEHNNISYNDGFSKSTNIYWHGKFEKDNEINFLKLHGSINWFSTGGGQNLRLNLSDKPFNYPAIHMIIGTSYNYLPLILIGTFNKLNSYLSGVFEHLYYSFKLNLEKSNILIVAGYGFGDKGINMVINHWLYKNAGNKLIIIHPEREKLWDNARGQFYKIYNRFYDDKNNLIDEVYTEKLIFFIDKKFEDVEIIDFDALNL